MRARSIDTLKALPIILCVACLPSCGGNDNKAAETNASIPEKVSQDETAAQYVDKVEPFFEQHCHR